MTKTMLRAFRQVARIWGCHLTDLRGMNLREVFTAIDSSEYPVYWGCWTEKSLDRRLGE